MSVQTIVNPEREVWNRIVAGLPGGNVFQSYEWGEIRAEQGWVPHYVAVQAGGDWTAAALVLVKRLPAGLGALLYSPRGPLVKDAEDALPLIEAVRRLARDTGGLLWRVEPPVIVEDVERSRAFQQAGFQPVPMEWSYWNRPKYEMHRDLSSGEAAVFASLGTKIRTKIRHAPKRGVVIEEGCGEQDVESFYRLLKDTGIKKRIPVRALGYFHALYRTFIKTGMGRLFLARKDATAVAGGITVRFGPTATLLYLSNDYSMQRAGWAIQWEMMRWAMMQGCRLYDFGGTGTNYPPQETDKGYGVYQFKRSFGADIVRWVGYADYVFSPTRYAGFRLLERNLPYGERIFIEWPKRVVQRCRGIGGPNNAGDQAAQGASASARSDE